MMGDLLDGLVELAGDAIGAAAQAVAGGAGALLEGAGHAADAAASTVGPAVAHLAERAIDAASGGSSDSPTLAGVEAVADVVDFSDAFEKDDRPPQTDEKHRQQIEPSPHAQAQDSGDLFA